MLDVQLKLLSFFNQLETKRHLPEVNNCLSRPLRARLRLDCVCVYVCVCVFVCVAVLAERLVSHGFLGIALVIMTECAFLYERTQQAKPLCCNALIYLQLLMINCTTARPCKGLCCTTIQYFLVCCFTMNSYVFKFRSRIPLQFLAVLQLLSQVCYSLFEHCLLQQPVSSFMSKSHKLTHI